MKALFKAVATVTIFSVITRLLGFFFRIFLSRKLGSTGLGLFQMATSILGIFMTLIASGLPLSTAKLVSKYEANGAYRQCNKVVSSALIISILISLVSIVLILVCKNIWCVVLKDCRASAILLLLTPSILFSAIYSIFRGALWGQNDYFNCGLSELIEQIVRFVLSVVLLINVKDIFIATQKSAIAFDITCFVSALFVCVIYFKRSALDFKKGEYGSILKSAVPITCVRFVSSLIQPLTTLIIPTMLMVAGYTSGEAISSFGVIMGMTFPLLFVPMSLVGSISMVLIPSTASLIAQKQYEQINKNINSAIGITLYVCMLFVPLYLSVGNLIGVVLYDNALSGVMLQLSAVCVLPISLCNLSGSILNALNLEVKSFGNYLIGSAVLFLGLIILTPLIAINSVSVSFFLSMSVISLLNIKRIKKALPNLQLNVFAKIIKYTFIILPTSLMGHFVANLCLFVLPNFISAVIGGGCAILATIILCKVFGLFDITEIVKILKHKKCV